MRAHFTTCLGGVLMVAVMAAPAFGQTTAAEVGVTPPNLPLLTLSGATADNARVLQALLEAGIKEKVATAVIGVKHGQGVFRVTFKAPVGDNGEAVPATLDGLSSGASVELSANRLFWKLPTKADRERLREIYQQVPSGTPRNVENLPKDLQAEARILSGEEQRAWFMGGALGSGRTTFAFLDGPALTKETRHEVDVAASGRIGYFTRRFGFVTGSVTYRKAYTAGSAPVSVCRPIEGTTASQCAPAVLKPPKRGVSHVVSIEARRVLGSGTAIAPSVQWDVKNKVTSVLVPVYFLKDADGGATGGLRGAWRSDTRTVTLSLFIGGTFKLLP